MQYISRNTIQYNNFFKRLISAAIVLFTLSVVIFGSSETAHASLVSFVSSLLSSSPVSAEVTTKNTIQNSSNMPILQAHSNIDPTGTASVADAVPVDDGETLVPDLALANATSSDTSNTQIGIYVVHAGDTISSVAKMFRVSVNTILWANDLSSRSILQAGQTLVILPISGINYTVKKGDTLKGIAQKYKADVDDILNFNDLTIGSTLTAGQTILIPDAELATPQPVVRRITKAPYEPILDNIWSLPTYPGYYSCPIPGARLTQGLHGHNAIDLGAPLGTPIHAAAAGTVIIARINGGWNGGYGNYVVIAHPNGTQTLYGHMSKSYSYSGQNVSSGQIIGYVGSTGESTGPHLHLEIRGAQNVFTSQQNCQ